MQKLSHTYLDTLSFVFRNVYTSSDVGELTEPHIKLSYSLLAIRMSRGGNFSEVLSFFLGKTKILPQRRKFRNKKNFSPMPRISSTWKKKAVRLTYTHANNLECLLLVAVLQTLLVPVSVGHHQLLDQSKKMIQILEVL